MVNILFFEILISFNILSSDSSNNLLSYEKALFAIKKTEEYKVLNNDNDRYYVSDEIISFYVMGWFYKKELESIFNLTEKDFISDSTLIVEQKKELLKLGTKKSAKVKMFFSQIKKGVFLCELFKSHKKVTHYESRPFFGQSFIYMFEEQNDKIVLINVKKVNYN